MHRNDPLKQARICYDPPPPEQRKKEKKYPRKRNLHYPKNIHFFEIQDFEPLKWSEPTYILKYQSIPLSTPGI